MKKTFFLLTGVLFILLFLGCPNATETPKSNNANLQALTFSTGTLSPDFSPTEMNYTVTVPYETTSLIVTGTKADDNATMTPSDGKLEFTNLSVGNSAEQTIKVTAEDGKTTQEYKVKVVKLPSNVATLSKLTTTEGSLNPEFDAATTSYTITVPNSVTSLTVTGTANANATMTPSDGKLSFTNLSVGNSAEQTIKVTAEDGKTTQEYKVKVVKLPSNVATLSKLTTTEGSLNPEFDAATTSYTITVPNSVTSLTVTGTANANATMTPSDGKLSFTNLSVGTSAEQTIKVTAADGKTTQEYKVKVYRQSNVATLSDLTTDEGYDLKPKFNAATLEYTVTVPNSVKELTVTGTKADDNATMTPSDGKLSFTELLVGTSDEQTIKVTSEDSNVTNEYKVKVLREMLEMVPVPAGSFQRDGTETNVSVITKPYSLGKYQITRQQFKDIMGTDPSSTGYSNGMDDPVQYVNWYHAIAFCNKLSLKEGLEPVYTVSVVSNWANLDFSSIPTSSNANWNAATCDWEANGYRLPTEMEWMWAAMGADKDARADAIDAEGINRTGWSKKYAGEGYGSGTSIDDYAWYTSNSRRTHPVGGKLPNELGLYDMSGNVWEWCWDWYDDYPTGTLTDYSGAGSGSCSVSRGGSWGGGASLCTVAYRGKDHPYFQNYYRGFRVLRPVL